MTRLFAAVGLQAVGQIAASSAISSAARGDRDDGRRASRRARSGASTTGISLAASGPAQTCPGMSLGHGSNRDSPRGRAAPDNKRQSGRSVQDQAGAGQADRASVRGTRGKSAGAEPRAAGSPSMTRRSSRCSSGRRAQHRLEPAVPQRVINQPEDQQDDCQHPGEVEHDLAGTSRDAGPSRPPRLSTSVQPARIVQAEATTSTAALANDQPTRSARAANPGPLESVQSRDRSGARSAGAHKPANLKLVGSQCAGDEGEQD